MGDDFFLGITSQDERIEAIIEINHPIFGLYFAFQTLYSS